MSRRDPADYVPLRQQRPLGEFPHEVVELTCVHCPMTDKLSRAKLIAAYGPDVGLVGLLNHLNSDCERSQNPIPGGPRCGARYVGLT